MSLIEPPENEAELERALNLAIARRQEEARRRTALPTAPAPTTARRIPAGLVPGLPPPAAQPRARPRPQPRPPAPAPGPRVPAVRGPRVAPVEELPAPRTPVLRPAPVPAPLPERAAFVPELLAPPLQSGEHATDRMHCPLCGMMADLDRLERSPYLLRLWVQVWGGPVKPGTRRVTRTGRVIDRTANRRGSIAYFPADTPDATEAVTEIVLRAAREIVRRAEAGEL